MGKRYQHTSDLLAGLSVNGPCSTRHVAKYVLENTPSRGHRPVRDPESGNLAKNYNNLINDKSSSKKRWPGLLSEKYVIKIDERLNEKNVTTYAYTLTPKGCLVALGYEFNDNALTSFIKSAARNNLYFAYINNILPKTSISFVKEIFFDPIYEIIKRGRISLEENIGFYFSNIAEVIGHALYQRYNKVLSADYDQIVKSVHAEIEDTIGDSIDTREKFMLECVMIDRKYHQHMDGKPVPNDDEIEILIKNTFYAQINFDDWIDRMVNYFYPNEDDMIFHRDYSDCADARLLYKVMYSIHNSYFNVFGLGTPKLTNKLPPNSKEWKLQYRYNKKSLMLRKRLIAG